MYADAAREFFSAHCDAGSSSSNSGDNNVERWRVLGPAAAQHSHLSSVFKHSGDEKIAGPFLPRDCVDEPADVRWEDGWKGDCAGIIVWGVVSLALLGLFLRIRSYQPLRFRSQGTIISHWTTLSFIVVAVHLLHSMGLSAPCELEFVAMALVLPAVLVFYIMKTAHLIFIFQWTLAKSQDNMWKVNRFFRFRHFVSDQMYFLVQGVLLVVNTAWAFSYLHANDAYGNMFNSLRCQWWEIPSEYQAPQVSSDVCYCAFDIFGSRCEDAIEAACTSGTDPNYGIIVDSNGADICSTLDMSGWQRDVIKAGVCGFFAITPDLDNCQICMRGDPAAILPLVIELCVLLAILVVLATVARHKHDAMLVQVESTLAAIAVLPIIGYNIAVLASEDIFEERLNALGYTANHFMVLVFCWWCLMISFAFPLAVACRNSSDVLCKLSETVASSDDNTARATGEYSDDLQQLQFVLDNAHARLIFMDFSTATFTIENIRFLTALYDSYKYLLENFHKHSALRKEIKDNMMRMLRTNYIEVGAPLEVNISDKTRKEILQLYESQSPASKAKGVCAFDASDRFAESNWKGLLGTIEMAAASGKDSLSGARRSSAAEPMVETELVGTIEDSEQPQRQPPAASPVATQQPTTATKPGRTANAATFDMDFTKFAQDMIGDLFTELDSNVKRASTRYQQPTNGPGANATDVEAPAKPTQESEPTTAGTTPTTSASPDNVPQAKPIIAVHRKSQIRIATSQRSASLGSMESREEDDADEVIEWLRPAIEEVTNLILKDTWGRFKRSTYYGTFFELFITSTRVGRAVNNMMVDGERDRKSLNIIQIMNPNTPNNGRSSMDKGSPKHTFLSSFRKSDGSRKQRSSRGEIELQETNKHSTNV